MRLVPRPGAVMPGPKALWGFYGYSFQNLPSALQGLGLVLQEGEFAQYTVRDVKGSCPVSLKLCGRKKGRLKVSCGQGEKLLPFEGEESLREILALDIPEGKEHALRVECLEGEIYLEEVSFG